jgi:hypothetical protein
LLLNVKVLRQHGRAAQVEELKTTNRDLLEQVISHCPPPEPAHTPALGGEPLRRTRTTPL